MINRHENWPESLHDIFMAHAETRFEFGQHDCLLAVGNAIYAMTGVDPAAGFRGKYTCQLGFMRLVQEKGCKSLEHLVSTLATEHGMKEVGVRLAQRGDLVLFDTEEGPAFGIVHHNGVDAVCTGPDGLMRIPTLQARRAWRVGDIGLTRTIPSRS